MRFISLEKLSIVPLQKQRYGFWQVHTRQVFDALEDNVVHFLALMVLKLPTVLLSKFTESHLLILSNEIFLSTNHKLLRVCMFALMSLISLSFAKEVPIASIEASSYRAPDSSTKYDPKQLFDGKSVTAWIEDDEGSGLGSWFEVSLAESSTISSLKMWNGYWYSFNEWDYHNRVAKMEISFEDGSKEVFELDDNKKVETIEFAKPHTGKTFKVRFAKVHSGSAYAERTAVSGLRCTIRLRNHF